MATSPEHLSFQDLCHLSATELAKIVMDPSADEHLRGQAFQVLRKNHVKRIIRMVAIRKGWKCKRIVREVYENSNLDLWMLLEKGAYDPSRGKFGSWYAKVARNRLADEMRKKQREISVPPVQDEDGQEPTCTLDQVSQNPQPDATADPEKREQLKQESQQVYDQLLNVPPLAPRAQVDYVAVAALRFRLAMLKILKNYPNGRDLVQELSWPEALARRSLRRGWPTIQAIWDQIFAQPGHQSWVSGSELVEIIKEMLKRSGTEAEFSEATWDQWITRSRKHLLKHLPSQTVDEIIPPRSSGSSNEDR